MKKPKIISLCALSALVAVMLCSCYAAAVSDVPETYGSETAQSAEDMSAGEKGSIPKDGDGAFTVIIDPGHGFGDPGSQPEMLGRDEAEVTLAAALALRDKLNAAGINCVLTHDGNSFVSYGELCRRADGCGVLYDTAKMSDGDVFSAYERSIWANVLQKQYKNCFFVSLHTNSYEDPGISGLSIDYYAGDEKAAALADFCAAFDSAVKRELGKKCVVWEDTWDKAFIVCKYTKMPAVLIEMGYGTNSRDAADLGSAAWTDKFAAMLSELISDSAPALG